jgi:hypothetical protein
MKITKRQLRRIIKEAIDPMSNYSKLDDAAKEVFQRSLNIITKNPDADLKLEVEKQCQLLGCENSIDVITDMLASQIDLKNKKIDGMIKDYINEFGTDGDPVDIADEIGDRYQMGQGEIDKIEKRFRQVWMA